MDTCHICKEEFPDTEMLAVIVQPETGKSYLSSVCLKCAKSCENEIFNTAGGHEVGV